MKSVLSKIEHWVGLNPILLVLTLFIPIAIILELSHAEPLYILLVSAAAIIPLAAMIGEGTEALAEKVGERAGGLLNPGPVAFGRRYPARLSEV